MKFYKFLIIFALFFILVDAASAKSMENQKKKVTVLGEDETLISSDIDREGDDSYRQVGQQRDETILLE